MWHPKLDKAAQEEGLDGFFDGPVGEREPSLESADPEERRDAEWIQDKRESKKNFNIKDDAQPDSSSQASHSGK